MKKAKTSAKKMMGGGATKSAMKKLVAPKQQQLMPKGVSSNLLAGKSAKAGLVKDLAAKKRGMKSGGKCKGAGAATKGTRYSKS